MQRMFCEKNNIHRIRILEVVCWNYDNCMCIRCDNETLDTYDGILISLFEVLFYDEMINIKMRRELKVILAKRKV